MQTAIDEKNASYTRLGYYIHSTPILTPEEVRATVAGMDAVKDGVYETGRPPEPSPWIPGGDKRQLVKIEMPQLANRAVMHAISHPHLGELAAAVTGAEEMVQVWWVQELIKPPSDPSGKNATNVGWHQDLQYWGDWEPDSELFTAWLALSDVREDCGPMRFVRSSHEWGMLGKGDFYGQALDALKNEIAESGDKEWNEAAAVLPPGGVSFHHCLTVHGSGPNGSQGLRRSFAIHMRTEKSRPRNNEGLTQYVDNPAYCPVIWRR